MNSGQETLEDIRSKNDTVEKTLLPENIPDDWRIAKVGELIDRVRSRIDPDEMGAQNYVSLKHMGEGEPRIGGKSSAEDVSSQKYSFEKNDILFGKLRPYFRKVALAKFDGVCSTDVNVIRPTNKVDRDFLFYTLFREDFIDIADKTSTGTRMPRADWSQLNEMEIALPPLKQQEEISSKLYVIDEKIEINNRVNEILEEIAQALFKSWFVDYEPYEDFKHSELGEIPEDFEAGQLSHLVSLKNGKYIKKDDQSEDGEYPVYGSNGETKRTDEKNIDDRCVTIGRVGSIGEIHRVEEEAWVSDNCIIAKPDNQAQYYYLYLLLTQYNFERYNQGSSHPMITQEAVKSREVVIPSSEKIERFEKKVEPLFEDIFRRKEENKRLEEMRDTLLPKLMSGEIRVNVDGDE